eukprot:snap_masked-scaffold_35-processed-gene-0.8-mRNA-1 protein AED:1.00 eAED:1.00 QI:0/0/0/0/1/1/2/0/74
MQIELFSYLLSSLLKFGFDEIEKFCVVKGKIFCHTVVFFLSLNSKRNILSFEIYVNKPSKIHFINSIILNNRLI